MACHHASPEEAVQMHRDLRARRSVGMHWGAWALSAEPLLEPPARLAQAAAAAGLAPDAFITVQVGKWFSVPLDAPAARAKS
jgi:N-acyl-phosphatidylethanolamine-hydrolysing phospholipase D